MEVLPEPRNFVSAIVICLFRYFNFRDRAPRSEYWYFTLFNVLVSVITGIVDTLTNSPIFGLVISLGLTIPSIAVCVRRLHDTDRSGWWWFLAFIPIVGWIILLIWMCTRGTMAPNRFGADPLGGSAWGMHAAE